MKRYSLKAMLILVTVVGLFLGYSQWRRRSILRQVSELRSFWARVDVPDDWIDVVWQRRPSKGRLVNHCFDLDDPDIELEKMKALGVTDIKHEIGL
jgi:hypothetical protein